MIRHIWTCSKCGVVPSQEVGPQWSGESNRFVTWVHQPCGNVVLSEVVDYDPGYGQKLWPVPSREHVMASISIAVPLSVDDAVKLVIATATGCYTEADINPVESILAAAEILRAAYEHERELRGPVFELDDGTELIEDGECDE